MKTFHILYYEKPEDIISKGIDIQAHQMVNALQSFNREVEHHRLAAIFDKDAFFATPAYAEDKKVMESADALHEDQEYKSLIPSFDEFWELTKLRIDMGIKDPVSRGIARNKAFREIIEEEQPGKYSKSHIERFLESHTLNPLY